MPHRALFFLVDLAREAKPMVNALTRRHVYVQDGDTWDMPTYLRVSVGLANETEAFLKARELVYSTRGAGAL